MIGALLDRFRHNNRFAALRQENRRLREQLEQVRQDHARHLDEVADIQRRLLPQREQDIDGIRYAASYQPFKYAGGDYYDVVALPGAAGGGQAWGAIIADASGHGPAAAVEVAMLDAILRTYTGLGAGPAAVLAYINRHFFTRQIRKDFITALVINFDPASGQLSFANAGHHPALILRAATGQLETLECTPGIPLGVTPGYQWTDSSLRLASGDSLFLYTDGIIEARNADGDCFGPERLASIVGRGGEPQAMVTAVNAAVAGFRGKATQCDDESMLSIRIG